MSDNRSNGLETDSSAFFSLLEAIRFNLCRILNLKCEIYMYYQLTLSIQAFKTEQKVYPEISHSSRSPTLPYAKNPDQIMLNTLFVSLCFCDPISSNNLTNSGMFCNQSLTGEFVYRSTLFSVFQT